MTKVEFKYLEVGKIFVVGNKNLKVKYEKNLCQGCYFEELIMYCKDFTDYELIPACNRKDHSVVFAEVKK
ncbi:hypothetical protein [uncultured Fusobacterium sp.]|uniref:hypothetical protein n=1 Tax=uncultured Fusobacterium sp. TaxID=159267 RepID=UPI0025E24BA4|nr:hypothetical protein [uncultured Fusobacterium sp.]